MLEKLHNQVIFLYYSDLLQTKHIKFTSGKENYLPLQF